MSFCVQNLTNELKLVPVLVGNNLLDGHLRYQADNLILNAMTPGPTEPTSSQLQNYLEVVVDNLLMLYNDGMVVQTPEYPNGTHHNQSRKSLNSCNSGIRVRVALVAIIADHPAMCKLCGFADHSHNAAPCTKCRVPRSKMFSTKSLQNSPFKNSTHFIIILIVISRVSTPRWEDTP